MPRVKALTQDIIQFQENYYILATSSLADDRFRVLKHGDTFAVFDRYGDVLPVKSLGQGIFHNGTRYLSRLEFYLNGTRPLLLSSSILRDNTLFAIDLTNPDIISDGRITIPRGTLHIFRSKFLWDGSCFERIRISNYGAERVEAHLTFLLDTDFFDIFEVRGVKRKQRGVKSAPRWDGSKIILSYKGLDGVARRSLFEWDGPDKWSARRYGPYGVSFEKAIDPQATAILYFRLDCAMEGQRPKRMTYDHAYERAGRDQSHLCAEECGIETSSDQFNNWLNRSYADIHMMTTRLASGYYPYAGVPWFSTVFGRDGILTALSYLWVSPKLARGVLAHLAANQAKKKDPLRDAEPGKILHETRTGEMADLKEIPFGRYYGSIDSTPLFVVLAGAYLERTGDVEFIRSLWPNIEAALSWIEDSGDRDGDGFVEYHRQSKKGLANQGWKDSGDSVFHRDGSAATGSIALCEVQGYAFEAYQRGEQIAALIGKREHARRYGHNAQALRANFEKIFWSQRLKMYVLALDGNKRPCEVRTSNAGHALFSGIASARRAQQMAKILLGPRLFSGWGVRTVAHGESLYNPMSYHNGSIWPHDNALIAYGLARYGLKSSALQIMKGLFDASVFMDLNRLPELFCGFRRRRSEGPTLYPVACSPQAWASASPFLLLQSILGLSIYGMSERIHFDHPVLPPFLQELRIRDLAAGKNRVNLTLIRHQNDVGVNVTGRKGLVRVSVLK